MYLNYQLCVWVSCKWLQWVGLISFVVEEMPYIPGPGWFIKVVGVAFGPFNSLLAVVLSLGSLEWLVIVCSELLHF